MYDVGWDKLRETRYAKQLRSGLIPKKFKLSPRPTHVPAWDSLSAKEREWEADRMEVFAAMVDVLDQNVGRIVAKLKEKGVWDNTLFLFCSDNGACPFERTRGRHLKPWDPKSYWTYDASWAHAGNTPFRFYKQNQHEGGISSPLIVHWPKGLKTEPGSITRQPGHLIDFMGTFIDVTGAKYPKQIGDRKIDPLMGKSLLPILGVMSVSRMRIYISTSGPTAPFGRVRGSWSRPSSAAGSCTTLERTARKRTIWQRRIQNE